MTSGSEELSIPSVPASVWSQHIVFTALPLDSLQAWHTDHPPTLQGPNKSHPTTTSLEGLGMYGFALVEKVGELDGELRDGSRRFSVGGSPALEVSGSFRNEHVWCGVPGVTLHFDTGFHGLQLQTQGHVGRVGESDVCPQHVKMFRSNGLIHPSSIQRTFNSSTCQGVWTNDKYS